MASPLRNSRGSAAMGFVLAVAAILATEGITWERAVEDATRDIQLQARQRYPASFQPIFGDWDDCERAAGRYAGRPALVTTSECVAAAVRFATSRGIEDPAIMHAIRAQTKAREQAVEVVVPAWPLSTILGPSKERS